MIKAIFTSSALLLALSTSSMANTNDMTQEKMAALTGRVFSVYSPVVAQMGGILKLNIKWDEQDVDSFAMRFDKVWAMTFFGGLARHRLLTEDAMILATCHELGHFIGGAPLDDEDAIEGQADYFATSKCMRRVLEKDDNKTIVAKMNIDPEATKACSSIFKSENETALCKRIAMAGKSLAEVLGDVHGKNVSLTTPDNDIVNQTNMDYPEPQCRLDTYFSGALCSKPWSENVDMKDPAKGVCTAREGYKVGLRPLCWYKPTPEEM